MEIEFHLSTQIDKIFFWHNAAVAGGMMIAASYSLAFEGSSFNDSEGQSWLRSVK